MKIAFERSFSPKERAQFYAGHDRLELQGSHVQRVRELQEENDHLQREITSKEKEISGSLDPIRHPFRFRRSGYAPLGKLPSQKFLLK